MQNRMPTPTEVLPKILAISGDNWHREDITVILEKNEIPGTIPDIGAIINNALAIEAIQCHSDALWIIVDVMYFATRPDLIALVRDLGLQVRKKTICLIPPKEEIERMKKQKLLNKDFPDLNLWKLPLKRLGVIHLPTTPDEYIPCIAGKCLCTTAAPS